MNFGMFVISPFLNKFLIFTVVFCLESGFGQPLGMSGVSFKSRNRLQRLVLATRCVSQISVEQLKGCSANGGVVRRVVGKIHGWQEFFPIQGIIMDVGRQIFFDAFVEILPLGVALGMRQR